MVYGFEKLKRGTNGLAPSSQLRATSLFAPNLLKFFLSLAFSLSLCSTSFAITDTYFQTFEAVQEGATIDGVDSFIVSAGSPDNAIIESGKLNLVGASTTVNVNRTAEYSNLSPTWVEYVVKPGVGAEARDVPLNGIGAVNFNSTGVIMVSDGTKWLSTGKTYSADTWYRIILKIDFSSHLYDVYCENALIPKSPFIPDKQNLHFIDPTVDSLSTAGFMGAYNARGRADSLVDELVVHAVDKLQFITLPHTLVKGHASGLITAQLQNANSEPQTAWKDMSFELHSSTQTGEFSLDKNNWIPIGAVTLPQGAQQVSFYFKAFEEGSPTLSVNEFPDRGWTDAVQEEKVVSEGEYFGITATTPQTAGKPFNVQIIAKDSNGNPDVSYNDGAVDIFATYVSPASGSKILIPDTTTDFVQGVKNLAMAYPDAGIIKITVRDKNESSKVGYSGNLLFLPDSFTVTAGSTQIVGKNFPVTAQALEAGGQVTPNYEGPAKLEALPVNPANASGGVFNPSTAPAQSFQNGALTLNTSYDRWGVINVKISDSAYPGQKGQSAAVSFAPKSLSVSVKAPSSSRNFFYTNENMEITLSVLDENALPIENFQGSVSITPTPQFNIPSSYVFSEADKGRKTFVVPAGAAGFYKLKVEDVGENLFVESDRIEVKDATIVVSSGSAPVGTTSVEIQLVDSKGKRITSENEMTVTILFQEENENGTVFFSELGKPILFKKGIAKIVIGDTEEETVTISAKSQYGLKVTNGKVVFGRAGAGGVGTLMLRETKD